MHNTLTACFILSIVILCGGTASAHRPHDVVTQVALSP